MCVCFSLFISVAVFLRLESFAVAIVIASLAGPQWLLTEEKIPNINYNGTINYNAKDDGVYITKYTKSSLWILCFAQGRYDMQCIQMLHAYNVYIVKPYRYSRRPFSALSHL